jgi:beta-fructofuranosidase
MERKKPLEAGQDAREWQEQAKAVRARFADDPHRPRYHFLPPANWKNDPNGIIRWRGEYHVFYQHNPHGPYWGTIHWGHAASKDLVRWRDLPVALAPSPDGPDADGCFSGCAVDNGGVPTLLYTGVRGTRQSQCLATGSDDLILWTKHPGNPVIAAPPEGFRSDDFRDPYVWKEDGLWYMALGSGVRGVGGAVLLYRSADLIDWDYLGPLFRGKLEETGEMWECPNFFPLGKKHVLIVSVWPKTHVHYFVGSYKDYRFHPERDGKLDCSSSFFAPLSIQDDRGRRLMWGWLSEWRTLEAQKAAGWAGVLSLPHILTLRGDGSLGIEPAPELTALRGKHYRFADIDLAGASPVVLEGVQGDALELLVELELNGTRECGIALRRSPDGEEETRVVYGAAEGTLGIDRGRSSLSPDVELGVHEGQFALRSEETLRLHVFLDRSVIEVFAGGRASITSRVYPSRKDSLGIAAFADGAARVKSIDIWEMASIWS